MVRGRMVRGYLLKRLLAPLGLCRRECRRRQARASKQLGGRVMADTDRAFSEGADVEQWQRWAVGPSGLGSDGSGRAGKR